MDMSGCWILINRRTTSVRESRPPLTSRPNLARSQTSASRRQSVSVVQPDEPSLDVESNSISSSVRKVERAPNLFGAIFGPSKPAKPAKPQEQYVVKPIFYTRILLCPGNYVDPLSSLR